MKNGKMLGLVRYRDIKSSLKSIYSCRIEDGIDMFDVYPNGCLEKNVWGDKREGKLKQNGIAYHEMAQSFKETGWNCRIGDKMFSIKY